MKFEDFIKNSSALIAGCVVFFMAAGMYLSAKGFEMDNNGNIILMRQAHAQEAVPQRKEIDANLAMPEEHALGEKDAPVTIYEYSSFGCFHCADFHLDVLPKVKAEYIDKGLARVVFVPFPIDKPSMDAALLAECVDDDKYFAFAEVLFKQQHDWGMSRDPQKVLIQYAALSGLDNEKAKLCLKDDNQAREILGNRQNGISVLGIQGTPSFVISDKNGKELIPGISSFDQINDILAQRLEKLNQKVANK